MTHHAARAAAVAALLALTACASPNADTPTDPAPTSPPPSTSSTQPGDTEAPSRPTPTPGDNGNSAGADAAADAVAQAMWAADTRTDATPAAAAARAVQWMTPAYAAIATEPLPGGGGAEWLELTQHQGHIVADVIDADDVATDQPADTVTTATRARVIALTPHGADGWIGQPRQLLATMTLVNREGAWLVDAIALDEAQGGGEDMQDFG